MLYCKSKTQVKLALLQFSSFLNAKQICFRMGMNIGGISCFLQTLVPFLEAKTWAFLSQRWRVSMGEQVLLYLRCHNPSGTHHLTQAQLFERREGLVLWFSVGINKLILGVEKWGVLWAWIEEWVCLNFSVFLTKSMNVFGSYGKNVLQYKNQAWSMYFPEVKLNGTLSLNPQLQQFLWRAQLLLHWKHREMVFHVYRRGGNHVPHGNPQCRIPEANKTSSTCQKEPEAAALQRCKVTLKDSMSPVKASSIDIFLLEYSAIWGLTCKSTLHVVFLGNYMPPVPQEKDQEHEQVEAVSSAGGRTFWIESLQGW